MSAKVYGFLDKWGARIAVLIALAAFLVASHRGRQQIELHARSSCVAAQGERFALMEAWYGAFLARERDARRQKEPYPVGQDWQAAGTYHAYIARAMKRAGPTTSLTWPDPEVPGVQGPFTHPYGVSHYSCRQAFPDAKFISLT